MNPTAETLFILLFIAGVAMALLATWNDWNEHRTDQPPLISDEVHE
jgi:hypothetical protein